MSDPTPNRPNAKPSHPLWRIAKILAGIGFLGLGFVGLFLPILQGVLFLLIGLAILSTESRRIRAVKEAVKRRHPGPWRRANEWKHRLSSWFNRVKVGHREEPARDE